MFSSFRVYCNGRFAGIWKGVGDSLAAIQGTQDIIANTGMFGRNDFPHDGLWTVIDLVS